MGGSCCPGILSQTGYPEGDPLSVTGMVLINVVTHSIVTRAVQPVRVISYVDNWEVMSSQTESTAEALRVMSAFSDALDIKLDVAKSHAWSTTAEGRRSLKQLGWASNCMPKIWEVISTIPNELPTTHSVAG